MFGHMEVKGAGIMATTLFIKEKFGADGYKKWLDMLKPEVKNEFEKGILATRWYPFKEYFSEPIIAICDLFYNGDLKGAYDKGYFGANYTLRGIYSIFVKMATHQMVLNKSNSMLATFFKPSKVEVVEFSKNKFIVRYYLPENNKYTEEAQRGYWVATMEIMSLKNIKVSITKAISADNDYTEFTGTWE